MDVATAMAHAGKSVERCQKRKCAKLKLAADQQGKQVREAAQHMLEQLFDKKIGANAFNKKAAKLKSDVLKTKTTIDHLQCSLDKCNADARALLDSFETALKHDCQVEKKVGACDRLKKAKAILRKKMINVDDYIVFIGLINPTNP